MYSAIRIRVLLLAAAMLAFAPASAFATASYSAIGQAAIGVANPVDGVIVEALDGTKTDTFTDEGPGGDADAVASADASLERIAMVGASVSGSAATNAASSAWAMASYDITITNTTNADIELGLIFEARLETAVAIDDPASEAAKAMALFAITVGGEAIAGADLSEMLTDVADTISADEFFEGKFSIFVPAGGTATLSLSAEAHGGARAGEQPMPEPTAFVAMATGAIVFGASSRRRKA